MNILEELAEIKKESLQNDWDLFLIKSWKSKSYEILSRLQSSFVADKNISYEDFYGLKRTPKFDNQKMCCVSRYMAAYLPKVSDALFNSNNSEKAILNYMKKFDTLDRPIDAKKKAKEVLEFKKANKEAYAEIKSHRLVHEQRKQSSQYNWKKVK